MFQRFSKHGGLRRAGMLVGLVAGLILVGITVFAQPGSVPEMALTATPSAAVSDIPLLATPTVPPEIVDVPENTPFLELGQELNAELSSQHPSVFFNYEADASEMIIFQILAQPPFPLYYVDVSYGFEAVYAPLLTDETGRQIHTIVRVMPESRTYTFRLDSSYPEGVSSPITVRRISPDMQTLDFGESQQGQLDLPVPVALYTFEGKGGTYISLNAQSSSPLFLSLYYLSGGQQQPIELAASIYNDRAGLSAIDMLGLPNDGRYAVAVKRQFYHGDTFPLPAAAFSLQLDEIDPIEIAYGDTVEGELTAETPALYYIFAGQQGDVMNARIATDDGLDTLLTLYDSGRYEIFTDDDSGHDLNPEIQRFPLSFVTLDAPIIEPIHILRVRVNQYGNYGTFSLSLEKDMPELGEEPVIWLWNDKTLANTYYIEGKAGETLRLKLRVLRGVNTPNFSVRQGDDQLVYMSATTLKEVETTFTVPQDGRVLVTLDSGERSMESEISVTRVEP